MSVASRVARCVCLPAASLLLATLVDPPAASAQQPVALPPVDVVSATTVPTPANQIASSVTVITAADLSRDQRRTLPEALATVPRLDIVHAGGPGAETSGFLRGTHSTHVKVPIDGVEATHAGN